MSEKTLFTRYKRFMKIEYVHSSEVGKTRNKKKVKKITFYWFLQFFLKKGHIWNVARNGLVFTKIYNDKEHRA